MPAAGPQPPGGDCLPLPPNLPGVQCGVHPQSIPLIQGGPEYDNVASHLSQQPLDQSQPLHTPRTTTTMNIVTPTRRKPETCNMPPTNCITKHRGLSLKTPLGLDPHRILAAQHHAKFRARCCGLLPCWLPAPPHPQPTPLVCLIMIYQ
jgi:hypothetical protein